MAIISCPSCSEQISDKAKECPHCDLSLAAQSLEQTQSSKRVERIKAIQSIQFQTMLALFVSIAGFIFYYLDDPIGDLQMQQWIGMGAIILGLVWYLINRVRIAYLTKQYKSER